MKRRIVKASLIFALALCCILMCTCNSIPISYTIVYIAQEGGKVYGDLCQKINDGENGTQVVAMPNAGYKFAGWSDGLDTLVRSEMNVCTDLVLTAQFELEIECSIIYSPSEGNIILGESIQTLKNGTSGSLVSVKSKNGYRFVKWSDGNIDRDRKDYFVKEDIAVEALSEKIVIECYSDNYLVRQLNVVDINDVDLSKLVGYKSNSRFLGWEFENWDSFAGTGMDAMYLIRQQYNMFGIVDIDNIKLRAVYCENDNGNVPLNSFTIGHALGGLNGEKYLNSKESFEYNYNLGQRFYEADIILTTDMKVVVSHGGTYSLDEFLAKSQDGFTVLTLTDLLDIMVFYDDIWVDFDTRNFAINGNPQQNYEILFSTFEDEIEKRGGVCLYDRVIVEIHPSFLEAVDIAEQYSGIKNFLYTLEGEYCNILGSLDTIDYWFAWCKTNGVFYVSLPWCHKNFCDIAKKYDIYLMVYSYNSPLSMYEFYDMGVDCVFTDFTFI